MKISAKAGRVTMKATGQVFSSLVAAQSALSPAAGAPEYHATSTRRSRIVMPRTGPNSVIRHLPQLIGKARHLDRNSGLVKHAHDKFASEHVGTGIKPLSQCPDRTTARALTSLFEDWAVHADPNGNMDFWGLTWLLTRTMTRDGESFAILRTRRVEDGLPVPLQIQTVEADHIPLDDDLDGGLRAGIAFDGIGRRTAYRVLRDHPGDQFVLGRMQTGLDFSMIPAADVCHVFVPRRLNQLRGEPDLTSVLVKLEQLEQFEDGELRKQLLKSNIGGVVTRPAGESGGAGPIEGEDDPVGADGMAETVFEPDSILYLEDGESIDWRPGGGDISGTYDAFVANHRRQVAAALNILYEQLTGDWSKAGSDRIVKLALQDARRHIVSMQHGVLVHQFVRRVWSRFVMLAELSGAVRRPAGMSDADFYRATFHPQAWEYTHPVQDINAQLMAIAGGLDSRRQKLAERGMDIEALDEEAAADAERAAGLGLVYSHEPVDPGTISDETDEETDA